jgi:hypothetical protein
MPPKPAREIVKLVKQIGVRNVILRYVDSAGNLKEIMVELDVLPEDAFDNGIKLTDLTSYSPVAAQAVSEDNIKMIYPDKLSAFLNVFQDNPSLACLCYLQKKDPAKPSPSNFLNSGGLTPRLLMFSPANVADFTMPNNLSTPSFGSNLMFSTNFGPLSAPPMPQMSAAPLSVANDTLVAAAAGKMPPPYMKSSGIMMTPMSPMKMSLPPPPLPSFGHVSDSNNDSNIMLPVHNGMSPVSPDSRIKQDFDSMSIEHRGSSAHLGSSKSRKHQGTSCHQCKNARSQDQLAFCNNSFNKRTGPDKRHCRKKFCQTCKYPHCKVSLAHISFLGLKKFYNDSVENSKTVPGWLCPSCRGICTCAACTRREPGKRERSPGGMDDENYDEDYSHHMHDEHFGQGGHDLGSQSELPMFPPALPGVGMVGGGPSLSFQGMISPSLSSFNGSNNKAFSLGGFPSIESSIDGGGGSMMEPLYPGVQQIPSGQMLSGKKRTERQEPRPVGRPRKKQNSPKRNKRSSDDMEDDDSE